MCLAKIVKICTRHLKFDLKLGVINQKFVAYRNLLLLRAVFYSKGLAIIYMKRCARVGTLRRPETLWERNVEYTWDYTRVIISL